MAATQLSELPEVKELAVANTRFSIAFLRKCGAKKPGENVFLGPFSITTALAMTHAGAAGSTAQEICSVLHWSTKEPPVKGFGAYLPLLSKNATKDGYILLSAQRIYLDSSLMLKKEFSLDVKKYFASKAKNVSFKTDFDGALADINRWVGNATRGKITNLLSCGSVNRYTDMVLVQATYFKGKWKSKFDVKDTTTADFYTPEGTIAVDMMRQTNCFPFGINHKLQCSALEMPYISKSKTSRDELDHDLSMLVLLPHARDGLNRLESALTFEDLHELRSELFNHHTKIPRFKMESTFELEGILSDMGMPSAFNPVGADFSNMAEVKPLQRLFISRVIHKAKLKVNEKGSKAEVATAISMPCCLSADGDSDPLPFIVDHPFLIFIVDKRADVILFMGRVAQP